MSTDKTQRVALITGANRGIGLGIVKALASIVGFVILGSRNTAEGEAAIAELATEYENVVCLHLDVNDPASVLECSHEVWRRFGRLDILINNAGIYQDIGSILETPAAIVETSLWTHGIGPFQMIKSCAPLMQKHRHGRIVNISSGLGALAGMKGGSIGYRMSKAALNVLTLVAADELQNSGILVNAMCPGWVSTRLTEFRGQRTPEEAADTVVYLATLADDGPTGLFFRDREPISW